MRKMIVNLIILWSNENLPPKEFLASKKYSSSRKMCQGFARGMVPPRRSSAQPPFYSPHTLSVSFLSALWNGAQIYFLGQSYPGGHCSPLVMPSALPVEDGVRIPLMEYYNILWKTILDGCIFLWLIVVCCLGVGVGTWVAHWPFRLSGFKPHRPWSNKC